MTDVPFAAVSGTPLTTPSRQALGADEVIERTLPPCTRLLQRMGPFLGESPFSLLAIPANAANQLCCARTMPIAWRATRSERAAASALLRCSSGGTGKRRDPGLGPTYKIEVVTTTVRSDDM